MQAVQELGLEDQVRVYGADISNADIAVITAEGSPWVATTATDPSNVGAVAVRAAAFRGRRGRAAGHRGAAGADHPGSARDGNIQNITELIGVFPMNTRDIVPSRGWLTAPCERSR